MTNPVRRLVLMLEKARKEFDSIAKGFRRDDDFALANEEMDLWEDRICEELIEFGALEAATNLRNAKWTIVAGEFEENTFRTLLDETGAPMKVQQELMRHADIRTTMNVYGKAMDESKRAAHGKVVGLVLPSQVA
jgi:integrase